MRHSHTLNQKEMMLVTLNGVARSHRRGGRGRHKPKSIAAVMAAKEQARRAGASDFEIEMALTTATRLRF